MPELEVAGIGGAAASSVVLEIAGVSGAQVAFLILEVSGLGSSTSALAVNPGLGGEAASFDTVRLSASSATDGVSPDHWGCRQVPTPGVPSVVLSGDPRSNYRTYTAPGTENGCVITWEWTAHAADGKLMGSATVQHRIRAHGWLFAGNPDGTLSAVRGPLVTGSRDPVNSGSANGLYTVLYTELY